MNLRVATALTAAAPDVIAQIQHVHNARPGAQPHVIEASVNPELISDQEAITVFWISVMEAPTAGSSEKARFTAKIGGMNLSQPDAALAWAAAASFYSQFIPLRTQAQQLAASAGSAAAGSPALASIAQQRAAVAASIDRLALTTHTNLLLIASPEGAASFRNNLAVVKSHMKIVGPPPM